MFVSLSFKCYHTLKYTRKELILDLLNALMTPEMLLNRSDCTYCNIIMLKRYKHSLNKSNSEKLLKHSNLQMHL